MRMLLSPIRRWMSWTGGPTLLEWCTLAFLVFVLALTGLQYMAVRSAHAPPAVMDAE